MLAVPAQINPVETSLSRHPQCLDGWVEYSNNCTVSSTEMLIH